MKKHEMSVIAEIRNSASNISQLETLSDEIISAASKMAHVLKNGGKIMACGNGGSMADASHFVGELVGRLGRERPGMAALTLNTDPSVTTSLANDYGYKDSLARQVKAIGSRDDLLFAISTSGSSGNIIEAAKAAQSLNLSIISLTGPKRSQLADLSDQSIKAPGEGTQRIQEAHSVIIHILCRIIEDEMFPA